MRDDTCMDGNAHTEAAQRMCISIWEMLKFDGHHDAMWEGIYASQPVGESLATLRTTMLRLGYPIERVQDTDLRRMA